MDFVTWKTNLKTHKECLNKLICFKILTTKTLGVDVYKMFKCNNNQVRVAQKWQES
jgi:hypothetical protein